MMGILAVVAFNSPGGAIFLQFQIWKIQFVKLLEWYMADYLYLLRLKVGPPYMRVTGTSY
jgi:hypothetical protein